MNSHAHHATPADVVTTAQAGAADVVNAAQGAAADVVNAAQHGAADVVTAAQGAADEVADSVVAAKVGAVSRLKRELSALEKDARAAAKKRLAGTRVEGLIEKLPGQIEGEVDALLDRVGLVRKARLAIVREEATISAEAAMAAHANHVDDGVSAAKGASSNGATAKKKKRA